MFTIETREKFFFLTKTSLKEIECLKKKFLPFLFYFSHAYSKNIIFQQVNSLKNLSKWKQKLSKAKIGYPNYAIISIRSNPSAILLAIFIGIDLGTTTNYVAILNPYGNVTMIKNRKGTSTIPSCVFFDNKNGRHVGQEAVDLKTRNIKNSN